MSALELQRFGACLILALSASALRLRLPAVAWQIPVATVLLQFAALSLPWYEAAMIAAVNAVGFALSQKQGRVGTMRVALARASVVMMAWAVVRDRKSTRLNSSH